MSNDYPLEEKFGLGDYTLLSVKNTTFEPLSPRSFVNYWIAAPQESTDIWVMAGWEGDDFIQGTDAVVNEIHGFGGDDYLHGSANHNDNIMAGNGNYKIYNYKGDDLIHGDNGSDLLSGGRGGDTLNGGNGNDSLYGAIGNDSLEGGAGDDLLMAGPGTNTLSGGEGSDRFALLKNADNLIVDFDPSEGDRLLIRRRHMSTVNVTSSMSATFGPQFKLQGKMGITTLDSDAGTTIDDIMDSIILRK